MKESIKNILFEVLIFLAVIILAVICVYMQTHSIMINLEDNTTYIEKKDAKLTSGEKIVIEKEQGIACIILGITILLFIINFDMMHRNEKTKEISREVENLISPSLAEVVVDGKIEIKHLIMSTIIDLSTRGNIEIINNNTLRLLSTGNLELYESKIVDLIFQDSNVVAFKDINNIFKKSNEKTVEFSKQIKIIKDLIVEKLYNIRIFSAKKTLINKVITGLSLFLIINLILILSGFLNALEALVTVNILLIGVYIYYLYKGTSMLEQKETNAFKSEKRKIYIFIICIIVSLILTIAKIIIYKPQMILLVLLTAVLNIIIIKNSKDVVLTDKGKKEKLKLLKLKNYIDEYSLMKDRDLSSTIVWDKYLAYATAFEIPNKVTDSIYESWYDLNLTLQFIDRIL